MKDETLLTEEQVAERYGYKKSTIGDWRRKGVGPKFIKIGRFAFYRPEAILAWELKREKQNTAKKI